MTDRNDSLPLLGIVCSVPYVHLQHYPSNCSRDTGGKVHTSYVSCLYFLTVRNKLEVFVATAGWGQKWISKNIPAMLAEIQQKRYAAVYIKFA